MIVPMKKITLLALETDRECLIEKLKKQGVVHVEKLQATGEALTKLLNTERDLSVVKNLLSEFVSKKPADGQPSCLAYDETLTFVSNVLGLYEAHKEDISKVGKIREELSRCEIWGDFNLKDFDFLKEKNIKLVPLEMSLKAFYDAELTKNLKLILVNTKNKVAHTLAILQKDEELSQNLSGEIKQFTLPTFSTFELREKLESLQAKIASYDQEMTKMACYMNSVDKTLAICKKEIETERVRLSMPQLKLSNESSNVISLTGYVPVQNADGVSRLAKENGWGCIAKEPDSDDAVPTQLKHNKFVNLISPLTDFLGTLPGYREPDISLWFLLFFGVFFAMIFGDAGYGSILTLLSIFVAVKTKMAKKPVHTGVYMFMYLGFMTVIWGTLVCNWFGINPNLLPAFFRQISWERIASVNHAGVENVNQNTNLMHLSFTLGFAQLAIAHIIGVCRSIKSPKFLGDVGSLAMLTGMYFVVLQLVVKMPLPFYQQYILILIGVGFALNFIFSNYETGLGQSIVESLKNIINMLLGVVNVFADIMSYIRLWAVGLAGGAISQAVNTMAGPTLTGALIVAGMIILLFGHGLNYAMNVLSVIVHGVRLNTLEFSNHLGLTWSGFKY
ncbi:MAG: V-type ATP synthase subunit I, partial [Treponema sp.]